MSNAQYVPDTVLGAWDRSVQESRQKSLPLWQNIPEDLKSNLDLVSQALHKWAISMVNHYLLCK